MDELNSLVNFMKEITLNETDEYVNEILSSYHQAIYNAGDALKIAYDIDREYSKSKEKLKIKFLLDDIEDILVEKISLPPPYEDIEERKIISINQNYGVIGLLYDGDVYATVDIMCKALKTNNAVIFNLGLNKNIGTNTMLINIMKEILPKFNRSANLFEINLEDKNDLTKAPLDMFIVLDNTKIDNDSCIKIINSNYKNASIYLESQRYLDFVKEICEKEDFNIDVYVKSGINYDDRAVKVKDIDEVVSIVAKNKINFSIAIFTDEIENGMKFIKNIKSKNSFINASPTLARKLDIDMKELYYQKICMI